MKKTIALLLVACGTAACSTGYPSDDRRGLAPVHVPVVERQNFAYDIPASASGVPASGMQALDAWFGSLGLRYGDRVYIDGANAAYARNDVARLAGRYGLLLADGAPVTQGSIEPGMARVVVTRAHASMPTCPAWEGESHGNPANESMPNFGCAVNGNLAAMIANPEDLVHGRPGAATVDARTSARAVRSYREQPLTGEGGLMEISTSEGE
ncbi:CpaD family pilus assembly protein [Sphingomicrobium clamense]|uniref:CpaD family pilus assembly protein n=1 Tax=Sphingomicrobium clamense TaxID=2851013 RepID=A0ABS6V5I8_9SPHN|nr:CpaD family pilus assembly lipoprotein [Sphingomicrobium sp. B8]MBW0144829.1 CpaD family pilus assembly protein [Sphingomicrobium sp. B8]